MIRVALLGCAGLCSVTLYGCKSDKGDTKPQDEADKDKKDTDPTKDKTKDKPEDKPKDKPRKGGKDGGKIDVDDDPDDRRDKGRKRGNDKVRDGSNILEVSDYGGGKMNHYKYKMNCKEFFHRLETDGPFREDFIIDFNNAVREVADDKRVDVKMPPVNLKNWEEQTAQFIVLPKSTKAFDANAFKDKNVQVSVEADEGAKVITGRNPEASVRMVLPKVAKSGPHFKSSIASIGQFLGDSSLGPNLHHSLLKEIGAEVRKKVTGQQDHAVDKKKHGSKRALQGKKETVWPNTDGTGEGWTHFRLDTYAKHGWGRYPSEWKNKPQ